MIDVHCHLVDAKYQKTDACEIVERARREGVEMIVNGTGMRENGEQISLAETIPGVWVCVGMAYEAGVTDMGECKKRLGELASHKKVVGIGEAGLNYYRGMTEELKKYQQELFEMHLELAEELGLPIEVHNREADEDVRQALRRHQPVLERGVVLHCFSGSAEFMEQMAGLGCWFSMGGMITYKKNDNLRSVAEQVPAERLLLETDAPYLPPEPVRGTINEPVNVKIVAERMAEIRNVTVAGLEQLTTDNAYRLFKLT